MKKIFIFISTFIVAAFFLWELTESPERFTSRLNTGVLVDKGMKPVNKELTDQSLSDFAKKHHSLVAKSIVHPTKTKEVYVYAKYGEGNLTKGLQEATKVEQKNSPALANYRIISGSLSEKKLADHFKSLGYDAKIFPKQSVLIVVISFLFSNTIMLSLIMFVLAFTALTIILRIKDLRSAGIRLISGQKLGTIMFESVKTDVLTVLAAFAISFGLSVAVLLAKGQLQLKGWKLILGVLLFYDGILLLISLILSLIYLLGLQRKDLMSIIKGKLPIGRLLGVMLFCQFLAVVLVGYGVNNVPIYYAELQEENRAAGKWQQQKNRVNGIHQGVGAGGYDDKSNEVDATNWYQLANEAIYQQNAIMVHHNFTNYSSMNTEEAKKASEHYDPEGNTLIVTPNYLTEQQVKLDSKMQDKMLHLEPGEFGLILPEKLKSEQLKYQQMYEKDISQRALGKAKTTAVIAYTADGEKRFNYNNNSALPDQFVKDPIIVVMTPRSTGDSIYAKTFWRKEAQESIFFPSYERTMKLLYKYQVARDVLEVSNSEQLYYKEVRFFRNQTISFIASSILGIITAALLFNSMNLLYFEEFRRSILIKRIAGMQFSELHRKYLLIQLAVLLTGVGLDLILTRNLWTSLVTFGLFGASLLITLGVQIKKEDQFTVAVLKGM
ncbi:bacteriocin-associated integral membrane family protein [Xylocopilactobacillus apicola]|uniref:Bacteriocin-associated integral membrane protein n=1 Tax=Xylocopilactobacillus apicola TaxID=2932184 RepID=A0AAU9CZ43_9LACO|nr:DUF1430 domain-containing protein [Xylocopilactobacillus apicola]BDR59279.1 hypothetical protein XA3_17200 [Xylocopilactobacillus apicola]